RQQHNIGDEDLLFLTVGSLMREKGHLDVAEAFREADFEGRPATLILNGNERRYSGNRSSFRVMRDKVGAYSRAIGDVYDAHGILAASAHVLHGFGHKLGVHRGRYTATPATFSEEVRAVIDKVHRQGTKKRVLLLDLPRSELIEAYLNADLFVFASHVECSPLVLFEAVAARTPFVIVASGSGEEIGRWTGGGVICPATLDVRGYTVPDAKLLGRYLADLVRDRGRLRQMGAAGRAAWRERFTWNLISDQYEQVFLGVSPATCKTRSSTAAREIETT